MHTKRIFGFDLIRATGAVLVLVAHSFLHLPAIPVGWHGAFDTPGMLAAEMFFALSGFLVGRILIADFALGVNRGSLFHFWTRRWLRTLPLYTLFLLLSAVSIYLLRGVDVLPLVPRYLVFVQNFHQVPPDFFGQSWTLSIEEWFYLLSPLTVYFLYTGVGSLDRAVLITFLIFFLLPLVFRVEHALVDTSASWRHLYRKAVLYRFDAIMAGVGMAWLYEFRPIWWVQLRRKLIVLGCLLLVLCAVVTEHFELTNTFLGKTFFFSALALGCAAVLPWFQTLPRPQSHLVREGVRHLALLSYSLYLANNEVSVLLRHPYVVGTLGLEQSFARAVLVFLTLTFFIAWAANRWVERPVLRLRDRKIPQWR